MDRKSLQIGDWASLSETDDIVPCVVTALHPDDLFVIQPGEDAGDVLSYDTIYPIPLTAEILEKNGWRKYGLPYEWRKGMWVQRWTHNDIIISFDILETPKYDGFTWEGVEINEVHIFQHTLRLCGLNDLADNFKV